MFCVQGMQFQEQLWLDFSSIYIYIFPSSSPLSPSNVSSLLWRQWGPRDLLNPQLFMLPGMNIGGLLPTYIQSAPSPCFWGRRWGSLRSGQCLWVQATRLKGHLLPFWRGPWMSRPSIHQCQLWKIGIYLRKCQMCFPCISVTTLVIGP